MGIGEGTFKHLAELSTRFQPSGRCLMLGRQKFRADRSTSGRLSRVLQRRRPELSLDACVQPDGYSESLFRTLGFGEIETLDYSDFEGAGLIWDLNDPVPEDWHGQFQFIFDGGTLEHVFDVPQALRNVFDLLADGGRFVSVNPLTGYVGHGMYQFNPELIWSFWKRSCNCRIHLCYAMDPAARFRHDFEDAPGVRREIETRWHGLTGMPPGRVLLCAEIEKTAESRPGGRALQGDYLARWTRANSRGTDTQQPSAMPRRTGAAA